MTTAAHTPGPWQIRPNPWHEGMFDIRSTGKGATVGYKPLAHVQGDKRETGRNGEANARLIAAAPELLTWLSWALNMLAGDADRESFQYQQARAAIAKATGRPA